MLADRCDGHSPPSAQLPRARGAFGWRKLDQPGFSYPCPGGVGSRMEVGQWGFTTELRGYSESPRVCVGGRVKVGYTSFMDARGPADYTGYASGRHTTVCTLMQAFKAPTPW